MQSARESNPMHALLRYLLPLGLLLSLQAAATAATSQARLRNGPMVTHTTMHSSQIWVQLDAPGTVALDYWLVDSPEVRFTSPAVETSASKGHTAKLKALEGIAPGQHYAFRVRVDNVPDEDSSGTFGRSRAGVGFGMKPETPSTPSSISPSRWAPVPSSTMPPQTVTGTRTAAITRYLRLSPTNNRTSCCGSATRSTIGKMTMSTPRA